MSKFYLGAQTPSGAADRLAMAAALIVLTIAMGIGIFGAILGLWLPVLRAGRLFLMF